MIRFQLSESDGNLSLKCVDCERCTWNPGSDCERQDHDHCPLCGHCMGRHTVAIDAIRPTR